MNTAVNGVTTGFMGTKTTNVLVVTMVILLANVCCGYANAREVFRPRYFLTHDPVQLGNDAASMDNTTPTFRATWCHPQQTACPIFKRRNVPDTSTCRPFKMGGGWTTFHRNVTIR